jgi:hypothetical protein
MTVIALTGYARSGKDTVGKILVDDYKYRRVAFGDLLKQIAEDLNSPIRLMGDPDDVPLHSTDGPHYYATIREVLASYDGSWERVKDAHPETRQYLVDLGNALRRRIPGVETGWWLEDAVLRHENVVNTNVYHAEELREIARHGGILIRVTRPGFGPANDDERATGKVDVDDTIDNDGTLEDLRAEVARVVGFWT